MLEPPNEEVRKFIELYRDDRIEKTALRLSGTDLPRNYIIDQLVGLKITQSKIPSWHAANEVVYPPKIALEQCSSEKTALFKSSLFKGESMIDLTAGIGVDSYFFSRSFKKITLVEPQRDLLDITQHNFSVLGVKNASFVCSDALSFIEKQKEQVDLIYIDPSRRGSGNAKKFMLEDCSPDIVEILPKLLDKCNRLLIKTSPFLDIRQTLEKLQAVSRVWVVAVNNECKEVLYEVGRGLTGDTIIHTINLLDRDREELTFTYSREKETESAFSAPLKYLYEPNNAILKAGAFKTTGITYGLSKLNPSTHLYTSDELADHFPGKIFEVISVGQYNSDFTAHFPQKMAIISIRNFPDNLQQIKKKLKLKEGGDIYLVASRGPLGKPVLICAKRLSKPSRPRL